MRADVKDAVSSGISETNPLSSVHTKLQHTAKDFTAIYKLIKPAVSKYLKQATAVNVSKKKVSSQKTSMNEKVQKLLRALNYSPEIVNSVASTVCKCYKKENAKQLVHTHLVHKFGQDKGLAIYRHVTKLL